MAPCAPNLEFKLFGIFLRASRSLHSPTMRKARESGAAFKHARWLDLVPTDLPRDHSTRYSCSR